MAQGLFFFFFLQDYLISGYFCPSSKMRGSPYSESHHHLVGSKICTFSITDPSLWNRISLRLSWFPSCLSFKSHYGPNSFPVQGIVSGKRVILLEDFFLAHNVLLFAFYRLMCHFRWFKLMFIDVLYVCHPESCANWATI